MITKGCKTSYFTEVFNQKTRQCDRAYSKRDRQFQQITFYLKTVATDFVGLKYIYFLEELKSKLTYTPPLLRAVFSTIHSALISNLLFCAIKIETIQSKALYTAHPSNNN